MKIFKNIIGTVLLLGMVLSTQGCSVPAKKALSEDDLTKLAEEYFEDYEVVDYEPGEPNKLILHDKTYDFDYYIASKVVSKGGLDGSTGIGKTGITKNTYTSSLGEKIEKIAKDDLDAVAKEYNCEYKINKLNDVESSLPDIFLTLYIQEDWSNEEIEEISEAFAQIIQEYNYNNALDTFAVQSFFPGTGEVYGRVLLPDMTWEYGSLDKNE